MDIGWIVGSIVITIGVLVVILGVLLIFFDSSVRTESDKKDWTIVLLREQTQMAKAFDEARKGAARMRSTASDSEIKALAFLAGPPQLLEMFIYLTDHVSIAFDWDPSREPPQWKAPGRPTPEDIKRNAAILVLWDREYISGVFPAGYDDYSMVASNGAMTVRATYDRLLEPPKAKSVDSQQRPQW
jgi:hypothetical protein